jgi:diguanylate cyclase (GGDEF)-like protein
MTQQGNNADRRKGLPADVHAALVDTLFGTVGSFVSGIFGGLLVPVISYARTRDPIFLVCTTVLLCFAAYRLAVLICYRRSSVEERRATAQRWEKLYSFGAIGFMTAVGVTAAILFRGHHDNVTVLYGVVIAMACAGALAGRNAGRPPIVYGQALGVLGPLAFVLLFEYEPWYWGLAAILCLVMTSAKSTTSFLNGIIVSALLNGREALLQRARFSSALDSMSHGLCMGDSDGRITVTNHRLRDLFHLAEDEAEGLLARDLAELIARKGELAVDEADEFVNAWESHVTARDSCLFSQMIGGRIYDFRCEPRDEGGFVIVVEDVTIARTASREIERMAHFDSLTGLPNRIQFHKRLRDSLSAPLREGYQLALLSVDLDQFKEVNDSRGHPTGDELLCLVARRLRSAVQADDLVARFGGDEFQILIETPTDMDCVGAIAQRIIDAVSEGYTIDRHPIRIGASIGIAIAPRDSLDADELIRCADMALYQAKADGRGVHRAFEPEMDVAMRRKREVEHRLRDAIATEDLDLHYQPIVDIRTGKIVACEALARLRHPTEGLVSPTEFIKVAEETGLINPLGDWVLRRACRDAAAWPKDIKVAVNFSAKQFAMGQDIARVIKDVLMISGLDPRRLEVEITETTLFEAKDALEQLRSISQAGVRISLDDFGTGYSSLSYLRQFPVHKIKIDRSFAQDIKAREAQAVIGSVSVLAQLLNVDLVIEGIEEREQLEALKGWNVTLVQGYVFSRPLPLKDLLPLMEGSAEPFEPHKLKHVA